MARYIQAGGLIPPGLLLLAIKLLRRGSPLGRGRRGGRSVGGPSRLRAPPRRVRSGGPGGVRVRCGAAPVAQLAGPEAAPPVSSPPAVFRWGAVPGAPRCALSVGAPPPLINLAPVFSYPLPP